MDYSAYPPNTVFVGAVEYVPRAAPTQGQPLQALTPVEFPPSKIDLGVTVPTNVAPALGPGLPPSIGPIPAAPLPLAIRAEDILNYIKKSSIPGQAFDALFIHQLLNYITYWGDVGIIENPAWTGEQGSPQRYVRLQDTTGYQACNQLTATWLSAKNLHRTEASLSNQIQRNFIRDSQAPSLSHDAIQQANQDLERRSLLGLAGRGRERHRGRGGRGRGGQRIQNA